MELSSRVKVLMIKQNKIITWVPVTSAQSRVSGLSPACPPCPGQASFWSRQRSFCKIFLWTCYKISFSKTQTKIILRPSTCSSQQSNFEPFPLRPFTAQFSIPQFLMLALFVSQLTEEDDTDDTNSCGWYTLPSLFLQARTGQNT